MTPLASPASACAADFSLARGPGTFISAAQRACPWRIAPCQNHAKRTRQAGDGILLGLYNGEISISTNLYNNEWRQYIGPICTGHGCCGRLRPPNHGPQRLASGGRPGYGCRGGDGGGRSLPGRPARPGHARRRPRAAARVRFRAGARPGVGPDPDRPDRRRRRPRA